MTERYEPPFSMTENMMNMVIEIGELTGQITAHNQLSTNPRLRRENRIKTIHSSLAIEDNTLSLGQVTAVIEGKKVLAPPQDIREVKNAYEAYERLQNLDPYSLDDLLEAHRYMMSGLIKEAGVFRSKNAGVYSGTELIHAGSPANYVPELMQSLFTWMKNSQIHLLIGRLWHSLLLQRWQPFFAWLPVETMIHEHQEAYYEAINASNTAGECTIFVEFMLGMIKSTLEEIVTSQS